MAACQPQARGVLNCAAARQHHVLSGEPQDVRIGPKRLPEAIGPPLGDQWSRIVQVQDLSKPSSHGDEATASRLTSATADAARPDAAPLDPAPLDAAALDAVSHDAAPLCDAVIVIFGAAVRPGGIPSPILRRRVEAAAAFGARFAAPLFVPTGGVGRFAPSEAAVMAGLLTQQYGIRPDRILLEETGTDTLSSARAVAVLLRAHGVAAPVFAASSRFHQPRCVLLLRLFGLDARTAGPPKVPSVSNSLIRWYWRLREALALPYDAALALLLRFRGR